MSNLNIVEKFNANQFGIHSNNLAFVEEVARVRKYYEFYDALPDTKQAPGEEPYGQTWKLPEGIDFIPTMEVRNIAKKLIDKQARFMMSKSPSLSCKAKSSTPALSGDTVADAAAVSTMKTLSSDAEDKRQLLDDILTKSGFWRQSLCAFKDCTIGKRVLLTVIANPGEEIKFRYFTMPEFQYQFDPSDISKLKQVSIVYQDERTKGMLSVKQIWYKWVYEMRTQMTQIADENGEMIDVPVPNSPVTCWYKKETVDGNDTLITQPVELEDLDNTLDLLGVAKKKEVVVPEQIDWTDTKLSQLPCKIILNGGLTGDIWGASDIKDLIDMATNYNRTNSDFRDALRFKMFEQPVFIDADSDSLGKIKIAPNAIIDLKTDPTLDTGEGNSRSAQVTSLSSSFSFVQAADSYLDRLKKDMYEYMDQPLPEEIKNVPSAKAMKFLYNDLVGRCEEKWSAGWDDAIKWALDFVSESIRTLNLYPDKRGKYLVNILTSDILSHNYPIPEDEEEQKATAISEVNAKVKSHKTYIKEFGDVEDEQMEWNEIMEEDSSANASLNAGLMPVQGDTTEPLDGVAQDTIAKAGIDSVATPPSKEAPGGADVTK